MSDIERLRNIAQIFSKNIETQEEQIENVQEIIKILKEIIANHQLLIEDTITSKFVFNSFFPLIVQSLAKHQPISKPLVLRIIPIKTNSTKQEFRT